MKLPWNSPIAALWLLWLLYWWWSSRAVKRAVRRESNASRAAHLVPLAIAAALLAWPTWPVSLGGELLGRRWIDDSPVLDRAGVLLVAAGLAVSVWARAVLGGNWSATVTLKEGHEIVSEGPYRLVRHPIYTGLLLGLAGTALARGDWRGVAAFVIASAALWRKLRLEERWLTEEFGTRYLDYRRRTRALIPFVL
jgi:protein-S-isoprenylcysteine O-methyltransferase Ste14